MYENYLLEWRLYATSAYKFTHAPSSAYHFYGEVFPCQADGYYPFNEEITADWIATEVARISEIDAGGFGHRPHFIMIVIECPRIW